MLATGPIFPAPGVSAAQPDTSAQDPDSVSEYGREACRTGRFQAAAEAWTQAAATYGARSNHEAQIEALRQGAAALQALGAYPEALLNLTRARLLAEQTGNAETGLLVDGATGGLYLLTGEHDKAESILAPAAQQALAFQQPQLAPVLNQLGNLRLSQERPGEALQAYKASYLMADQGSGPGLAAEARIGAARALEASGDRSKAESTLTEALEQLQSVAPSHAKAYALLASGRLFRQLAKDSAPGNRSRLNLRAYQSYSAARDTAEQIADLNASAYAFGYLAELYETEGKYPAALALARRAVFAAQEAQAPESLYRWQWQLGRLLAVQGKIDDAITAYQQSVYHLQAIRYDMVQSGGGRSLFREQVEPVYFGLADLLLQKGGVSNQPRRAGEAPAGRPGRYRAVEGDRTAGLLPGPVCRRVPGQDHGAGSDRPQHRRGLSGAAAGSNRASA